LGRCPKTLPKLPNLVQSLSLTLDASYLKSWFSPQSRIASLPSSNNILTTFCICGSLHWSIYWIQMRIQCKLGSKHMTKNPATPTFGNDLKWMPWSCRVAVWQLECTMYLGAFNSFVWHSMHEYNKLPACRPPRFSCLLALAIRARRILCLDSL